MFCRFFHSTITTFLFILLTSLSGHAAIYDWEDTPSDNIRKLRLSIPDSLETVRGILIHGNGAGGDATASVEYYENIKLAESLGFAILGTAKWGGFWWDSEIELFEEQIAAFAEESGHPELVNCPWLPRGHSNGGQMSYGLNASRPEKVIAFIVSKGAYYNKIGEETAALRTPGMLIAGENDSQLRRNNIKSLFTDNRPRGALWAWVEEEGIGHADGGGKDLKLEFLMECCRLRYPRNQSTLDGPIKLKNLNEYDGWLVDQSTWKDGLTKIHPSWNYTGESRLLGWVPNERIARLYQGFSSYDKASISVDGDSNVRPKGDITYSADLTGKDWDKIEFYDGEKKIGEMLNNSTDSASITYAVSEQRYHVTWGIVTLADGTQRATHLRRVFVNGDPLPDPYTKWADENLTLNERAEDFVLPSGTVTNLERFAFGLGLGPVDHNNLPNAQILRSSEATQFNFKVGEAAIEAGIIVTPQISRDLIDWTDIEVGADIYPQREGENVSMTLRHSFPTELFRLKIQRSY